MGRVWTSSMGFGVLGLVKGGSQPLLWMGWWGASRAEQTLRL